MMLKKAMTWC